MTEIEIRLDDVTTPDETIHANVSILADGEWKGDFGVTYRHDENAGAYVNRDYQEVRHMGGIYVDDLPGTALLRDVAGVIADRTNANVEQRFR